MMHWRETAMGVFGVAMVLLALTFVLREIVQVFAADEPEVPQGFVRLQVCANIPGGIPEGVSKWALVAASSVTLIGNPVGSPEGCVRVANLNNRRIYVVGDEYTIAAKVSRALAQLPCVDGQNHAAPVIADPK